MQDGSSAKQQTQHFSHKQAADFPIAPDLFDLKNNIPSIFYFL